MQLPFHDAGIAGFSVEVCDHGTTRHVKPRGDIDVASAEIARRPLSEALSDRVETLVLDLGETTFIDSTGVHLLVDTHARAREEGPRLIILPGPPVVQRVLEIAGVLEALPFAPAAPEPEAPAR